ncbi:MAG: hypothetical protein QXS55_03335 [Candidatus Woesearchaeota archaeon]
MRRITLSPTMTNTTRKTKRIKNTTTTSITIPIRIPNTKKPTRTNTSRLQTIKIIHTTRQLTLLTRINNTITTSGTGC